MPEAKKAKSKPVSFYPDQLEYMTERSGEVMIPGSMKKGISHSRYLQLLVNYDRSANILPKAIKLAMKEAA